MRIEEIDLRARIERPVAPHSHPVHELHYVVEGRARFDLRGRTIAVAPGDLFYTLPGSVHRMVGGAGREAVLQYIALFAPEPSLAEDLEIWAPGTVVQAGLGWQVLFHRLAGWHQSGGLKARAAATRFAGLLYEVLARRGTEADAPPPEAVERMLQRIQAATDRGVTMDELALVAGVDKAYATRLFKRHLGVPPVRYATELRLARAAAWLRGTDETVRLVAQRVGFDDPYHFSRAFKRWSGRSPEAYRRDIG